MPAYFPLTPLSSDFHEDHKDVNRVYKKRRTFYFLDSSVLVGEDLVGLLITAEAPETNGSGFFF